MEHHPLANPAQKFRIGAFGFRNKVMKTLPCSGSNLVAMGSTILRASGSIKPVQ